MKPERLLAATPDILLAHGKIVELPLIHQRFVATIQLLNKPP
jgi:hypothetical protein